MEITKHNIADQLANITNDIKRSCFIAFDAEFTAILSGESFKHSLFNSNAERYDNIKNEVSKMIMTQIGLTMFQYNRDIDTYVAVGYTFHLCPQNFGDIDQSFIFQASTLKFLCRHKFDFNKFTYEGLPYLSKAEEARIRQHLKEDTLFLNLSRSLEMEDEKQLQGYCSEVSKWLTTSDEGTMYIDVKCPVIRYIIHNEIRLRFPNVLTTNSLGNSNKVLIYRDKLVEGATSTTRADLDDNLMSYLLGFTHIVYLLETHKKPLVGHNLFLDTILLHNQFIGPLPNKYSMFKRNIHEMFPSVYDTKFISHEMSKKLSFDEVWKSNALQDLYEFFAEGKCKRLEKDVNPIRLSTPFDVKQTYHEAGWDAFCSGYCFVRLGHWAAGELSGKWRAVGPTQKLAALQHHQGKVNVIRGAVTHMNLDGEDPPRHRPSWLHVMSLQERVIDVSKDISKSVKKIAPSHVLLQVISNRLRLRPSHNWNQTSQGKRMVGRMQLLAKAKGKIFLQAGSPSHTGSATEVQRMLVGGAIYIAKEMVASALASFGSIDVKRYGRRTALIAAGSQHTADKILKQYRNSREYRIAVFNQYRHGVAGQVALWGGAFLTGSLVLYFLHNNMKTKSSLL